MRSTRTWLPSRPAAAALALALFASMWLAPHALANHGNQRLEVTPEVGSAQQGTQHTLTGTLYQGTTSVAGGANNSTGAIVLDFDIESGPNQGESYACTIVVGSSNCSISYQGDEGVGTDVIRTTVRGHTPDEAEGRYAGPTDCPNPPDPNEPGGTSSGTEDGCSQGSAQPGTTPENQADPTDVVRMDWTQSVTGDVCLDAEPNSDTNASGSTHEIVVRVTDGAKITDTSGEFDCSGTARAGILLELEMTDDEPNAFFQSVNGQTTNPSGGGPNRVTCTTDGNGECTTTIRTVSATAEGTNEVALGIQGSTPDDAVPTDNQETVSADWVQAGEMSSIEATPEADTNEVGTSHRVTALAEDDFGNSVSGELISFQVTGGPHANNDLDNDANTPNGYFGQCTTGTNGTCNQTYTGTETGDDTITVFDDDDSDFQFDLVGDEPSDQVSNTWVEAGQGTRTVRLDMETDPNNNNVDENGDCDGDVDPPINEGNWEDQAAPGQVARNSAHKICAERFGANDAPQAGPVTFRITSGPGHFTNSSGQTDLGDEVTVGESENGYNVTYLSSTETGTTAVEATAGGASDTGTAPWEARPGTARTITLEPDGTSSPSASEHEVTATVIDKFGNRVQGVQVTFSEDGAGRFIEGGSSTTRTTGAQGRATARTTTGSNETGEQEITASMNAGDTECEEPQNSPQTGDPAGTCSDTVTHTWTEDDGGEPSRPQCEQERVICGDDDDNIIEGTEGDDVIYAFGGNDTVDGKGGDDIIRLGSGDDVGIGGPGNDIVRGGSGDDVIRGGSGEDVLRGGGGDDVIRGGGGEDVLRGGGGADTVIGGAQTDNMRGGAGPDVLRGNRGHDGMRGGRGRDRLKGGRGNDRINGDRGHDSLFGNRGNDTLNGGPGRDTCRPGKGRRDRTRNCER